MTPDEFVALAQSMTYKPGYVIKVEREPRNRLVRVTITAPVACADTGKPTMVRMDGSWTDWQLEDFRDDGQEMGRAILASLVRELELHELKEWLRFGGVRHDEPHPEQKLKREASSWKPDMENVAKLLGLRR